MRGPVASRQRPRGVRCPPELLHLYDATVCDGTRFHQCLTADVSDTGLPGSRCVVRECEAAQEELSNVVGGQCEPGDVDRRFVELFDRIATQIDRSAGDGGNTVLRVLAAGDVRVEGGGRELADDEVAALSLLSSLRETTNRRSMIGRAD